VFYDVPLPAVDQRLGWIWWAPWVDGFNCWQELKRRDEVKLALQRLGMFAG
jgi:hypothetical protein